MSLARLTAPSSPEKGDSQTEITGMPPIASVRAWIRSNRKMSGTKYIDAVVSRSSSSSSRIRGCDAMGSVM